MPCQLPVEIATVTDDVFSYMCNLAMEKCSKKADKKKASCGGAAMRKRLLIKNFVSQMLAQDRQSRELSSPTSNCSSSNQSFDESFNISSCRSGTNGSSDEFGDEMEMDDFADEIDDEQKMRVNERRVMERHGKGDNGRRQQQQQLIPDEAQILASLQQQQQQRTTTTTTMAMTTFDGTGDDKDDGIGNEEDEEEEEENGEESMDGTTEKDDANGRSTLSTRNRHQTLTTVGEWKAVNAFDDDFHKVPIPDNRHANSLFGEESASVNDCWRFFTDQQSGKKQQQQYVEDFPDELLTDAEADTIDGKLYFVGKSELDEHHQLAGLVNMVPSEAMGGPNDFLRLNHASSLLTDLDQISYDQQQRRSRNRKRPWSLVFSAAAAGTADEALMPSSMCAIVDQNSVVDVFTAAAATSAVVGEQQHQHHHHHFHNAPHSASLLSPLCCGMLQMSPFGSAVSASEEAMLISGGAGGHGHGHGAAQQQPMFKRVKL